MHIGCRVCRTVFEVAGRFVNASLQKVNQFDRVVLIQVPEVCPQCKGLKVVRNDEQRDPDA